MTRRIRSDWGSVRRLPSGRWQARYHDRAGRSRSAPRTFPTRADAARFLAEVRVDLDRGAWFEPTAGRTTFSAYADAWVANRRVRGRPLSPRTVDLYQWLLRKHMLPSLGDQRLSQIDPQSVRVWYGGLTGSSGPGLSTAAKCYRLLRAICATAVADGEIARTPCVITGAGQEPHAQRPFISAGEAYAIAEAVGPRWRCLILTAAFCGLRFGELSALEWADVDLLHATIRVQGSAFERRGHGLEVGPPKSRAGLRTVSIPPHMLCEWEEHLRLYGEGRGLVFRGPQGGPLRASNFGSKVWRPAVRQLGLGGVHFHDLRGCAATLAAVSGATTAELMRRLGHATPDVALRYQHATADRDAAVARALSQYVTAALLETSPATKAVLRP